ESAFSCAVLADQRVDFTGVQIEIHTFQCVNTFEGLGDAASFQQFDRVHAGQSSVSGIESTVLVTTQYSAVIRLRAGSHRYVGTPKCFPRSIMSRRDSGIGEAPNSIPRVNVTPFHGLYVRLWFSSQIPSQGKSSRFHT